MRTMQIEIMKPVDFVFPDNVKTVALINRDSKSQTGTSYNFGMSNFTGDTTLNNIGLPNLCLDGLSKFLEEEAFFKQVKNYHDSLNERLADPYSELFELTKADALIFLNLLQFEDGVSVFFDGTFRTRVASSWSAIVKNETIPNVYSQVDTLFFSKSQYKEIQQENLQSLKIYQDAAKYLGKSFGKKMVPSWVPVYRIFYHSKNPEMIKAEKYAKNQDWLDAAEIWNKQTKNKNEEIAAKACYNMALACEMNGKYDLAIDWLNHKILTKHNEQYEINCEQYIRVLTLRKYEIEELEKQLRN
jgi:hypothetical protein